MNEQSPPEIFTRLEQRGIAYDKIKVLVQFAIPHEKLRFSQWFRGRRIDRVIRQLEEWNALLKKDFVLALSGDLKDQVEQHIRGLETLAVGVLIDTNATVGSWKLQLELLPTGHDEKGRPQYIRPRCQMVATHRKSKKVRVVQVRDNVLPGLAAMREAFEELGLWNALWKGNVSPTLTSKRTQQGWPIYTRFVIPSLYDYMAPYYQSPGHRWATHGPMKHSARFPQAIFEDMLGILRQEHPSVFSETTVPQIRAVVQRHLAPKKTK